MLESRTGTEFQPRRTCIGCRETTTKDRLIRCAYSVELDQIVIDKRQRMPGRGAWIHPHEDCIKKAVRGRGFYRALRIMDNGSHATISVDITALK